jgi:hypothetical protein
VKVHINLKGSDFSKEFPLIMMEYWFEPGTNIENVMKAIHNPHLRKIWDTGIDKADVIDVHNNKIILWHQVNKSAIKVIS